MSEQSRTTPNWLGSEIGLVRKTVTVMASSGIPVTENDRKILKSGSLINDKDLGYGLLWNDADVTDEGGKVASIMIRGTYIDKALPVSVSDKAKELAKRGLYSIEYSETKIAYGKVPRSVSDKTSLLEALNNGDNILLENDITDIDTRIEITKDTVIDLNGKKLEGSAGGNSALLWSTGGELTIKGKGTITCTDGYAVYVGSVASGDKKGKVVIEDGTFTAQTTAVHVICGTAEIRGGTFKLSNSAGAYGAKFLLNCQDTSVDKASIVVTGGTYYDFNPASNDADDKDAGGKTNYVASGYKSVKDTSQNIWTVVKA